MVTCRCPVARARQAKVAYLGGDALTRTHTATRTIHVLAHHATPD